MGNWIDRNPRLLAAQVFLSTQNISVALCCTILGVFFWDSLYDDWDDWVSYMVSAIVIIVATVANLSAVGSKIVVEKDWIVVIADGDNNRLANINAVFRTVDLTCLVLSPMVAGLLFDFVGISFTAALIAGWNIVSVCVECYMLVLIYKQYPGLSHKPAEREETKVGKTIKQNLSQTVQCWKIYWRHDVRNAGFSLACLHMTVLGFDNITYGYLLEQCVRESILGSLVGISAIVGVTASVSFPFLRRSVNVTRTGLIGWFVLTASLAVCVASVWLPGSPFKYYSDNRSNHNGTVNNFDDEGDCEIESFASLSSLIAGIIIARYGLWLVDLSVTQALQESVDEILRGTVGGVQGGLNSFMDTIKFALVIALPNQDAFGWLILASYAFVLLGMGMYVMYARSRSMIVVQEDI